MRYTYYDDVPKLSDGLAKGFRYLTRTPMRVLLTSALVYCLAMSGILLLLAYCDLCLYIPSRQISSEGDTIQVALDKRFSFLLAHVGDTPDIEDIEGNLHRAEFTTARTAFEATDDQITLRLLCAQDDEKAIKSIRLRNVQALQFFRGYCRYVETWLGRFRRKPIEAILTRSGGKPHIEIE